MNLDKICDELHSATEQARLQGYREALVDIELAFGEMSSAIKSKIASVDAELTKESPPRKVARPRKGKAKAKAPINKTGKARGLIRTMMADNDVIRRSELVQACVAEGGDRHAVGNALDSMKKAGEIEAAGPPGMYRRASVSNGSGATAAAPPPA